MKHNTVEKLIKIILEEFDETAADEVTPDSDVKRLSQWNSINALFLIARIEQEFNVKITIEELRETKKLDDIASIITNKK